MMRQTKRSLKICASHSFSDSGHSFVPRWISRRGSRCSEAHAIQDSTNFRYNPVSPMAIRSSSHCITSQRWNQAKPFFHVICLVVQFEIKLDRRQRLICKCLKSSHKDWPLANSENPKDDNNARKRGQFFGESVFVTEAWEIWSPVFAPVWRFLSMWKCPIKLLWWFAMLIQYNDKK